MYPSSSVSPLEVLSPRKMVGSALYRWPPLSSAVTATDGFRLFFLCRLPLQRCSSRERVVPPAAAASGFPQAWAPDTEPSAEFRLPSRYPNWFWKTTTLLMLLHKYLLILN